MNRLILIAFAIGTLCHGGELASAQDSTSTWNKALVGQLSGAQAGFQNWAEGGVNTLAVSFGVDGGATKNTGAWNQAHELKLSFGLVKQDTLDFRKAEDLIRLRSTLKYKGQRFFSRFKPTVAAGAKTQFAPGNNFVSDPLEGGRIPPVKVSDLFAPAVLTQSLGLTYDEAAWFTQRLGISAKETIVTIDRLAPLYGLDAGSTVRAELGLEAFTTVDRQVAENIRYKSSLGLFASFRTIDEPDVLWENLVAMKVNSWLGVNFEWTMLLDRDVSTEVQLKEVFSIGISYIFV